MAQPVWTLSVDLQTRTATFQSGMSDAAKAARGSFNDIKQGAREMGAETGYSMGEARHGVMLLGEEFGLHLPRGVTSFLASLGPVGAAMEAAFPFLAIAVGATFLIEKLTKLGDEAAKSGKEWTAISEDVSKWGENSRKELLDVQIQLDKLNGDKLKELQDTLKKIDLTTLEHLKSEFDGVSKKADEAFTKMRSSWLMTQIGMGNGVGDVQEMFASAMDKINADLAKGDQKKLAADLKAASDQMWNLAAPTYDLVQRLHEAHNETGATRIAADEHYQALLKAHGVMVGMTKELTDQEKIEKGKAALATASITPKDDVIDLLSHREQAERRMSELRKKAAQEEEALGEAKLHADDAFRKAMQAEGEERAKLAQEAAKEDAGHGNRMADLQLAADKEAGEMRIMQGRMTEAQIADMEMSFAAREYATKQAALNAELAALDTHDKEYINRKQQLNNKLLELDKQYQNKAQQLEDQTAKKELGDIQGAEQRMKSVYAEGFASVLTGKQSFARMMQQIDSQIASSAVKNALQNLMTHDAIGERKQLRNARTAASDAFEKAGNPFLGAVEAAGAFAAVMAFQDGGIVPGVGKGDTVHAMLEPGEGILSNRVMEKLNNVSKFGSSSSGGDVHVHHHATYNVHAIDADGVHQMLREHGDKFTNHAVNTLRKMNR